MFQTASLEEIKNGLVSDVYFERTRQVLEKLNINKHVTAEIVLKKFPADYKWGVWAGLEESLEVLIGLNINVWSMPEGTIFDVNQPLMVIEGPYLEFGIYETALLGFLCQASGIATKAARCRLAAGNRQVVSFGARRMHPSIAPMIERNAYVGGCNGVAVVKSAELLGLEPSGTIPHALILIMGDTVSAVKAFNEIINKKVKRVALIDTFLDEKFEALNVAQALGDDLFGIRLDTPGNRRGDFLSIIKEVRWELDLRGFHNVKILVSGGIDEYKILELNEVVDAYGVGTSISNSPVLDY
jgi:nicotinate phosphoribosyltransferase